MQKGHNIDDHQENNVAFADGIANFERQTDGRFSPSVDASTTAKNPRWMPIKKSAIPRLQTGKRGTLYHQSNKSWQGISGPLKKKKEDKQV